MSRSWERMVQRNAKKVDKLRKKEGRPPIGSKAAREDRFRGRNYIFPTLLVLFMIFYIITFAPWVMGSEEAEGSTAMFWVTLSCYVLLAVFYFFRRPYLSVTRDTLETRRFTGYKTLRPSEIRKIVLAPGYITIQSVKGANWVFSRVFNLYPIARMSERLTEFARTHQIELEVMEK